MVEPRSLNGPLNYLLDLRRGRPEELDVPGPDDLLVLGQCLLRVRLVPEEHEGVARGPPVRLAHEQHPALAVQD